MMAFAPRFTVLVLAVLLASCARDQAPPVQQAAPQAAPPATAADAIAAAVADPTRPGDARVRDPFRKPAEVLAFGGVQPGETIVELAPGGGYDTALLSRVVGSSGKVYSIDCDRLFEYMPTLRESFTKYIAQDPRDNVEYSVQRFDNLKLPENVDRIWLSMFYHDTIWLDVDRAAMNRSLFQHLKPGGVLLVVDHKALPGAGNAVTRELHRVDPDTVRSEIEAAGFVLQAESDVLAHPEDPHTDSVFAEDRRGRTDRFVWRFVRPQ